MKTKTKKILIACGVVLALIAAMPVWFFTSVNREMKKMHPLDTQEIMPGIYALRDGHVNMYLVKHANGYFAVDAGSSAEGIQKELDKLAIKPGQVTDVILTHSDEDHAGAVDLFASAALYLSAQEEQMINGERTRFFIFKNGLNKKHESVQDGQTLDIGGRQVRFILAPGHTPGSMCVQVDGRYLFTGDVLSLHHGQIGEFTPLFTMDMQADAKSIQMLKARVFPEVTCLFTGHHGYLELKK